MNVAKSIVLESGTALRSAQRKGSDALWERIALLNRTDQIVLELSLRSGASTRQIGRLLDRPPGSISRQLRRLGRRLHDPIVLAPLHPHCPLDPEHRQIGVERFLCGVVVPELARRHQISAVRVRSILHLIQGWNRGASRTPRPRYAD